MIARVPPLRLACAPTPGNDLGNDGVMALLAPALQSMPQMTSLDLRSACGGREQRAGQRHSVASLCGLVPDA